MSSGKEWYLLYNVIITKCLPLQILWTIFQLYKIIKKAKHIQSGLLTAYIL